jgi:FtsZ-binding cell division protein ZapB
MSQSSQSEDSGAEPYDFYRLERVIAELISGRRRLQNENQLLKQELLERDQTVQSLDQEIAQLKARRTDALKRLDAVIGQVDEFEAIVAQAGS